MYRRDAIPEITLRIPGEILPKIEKFENDASAAAGTRDRHARLSGDEPRSDARHRVYHSLSCSLAHS